MKYLPLLWAGLWRKPARTILTMASIAVAFLLFGLMQGVIAGFDTAVSKMSATRLRVMNRTNLFEVLPIAYEARIARVPGVRATAHMAALASTFRDPGNSIQAYGTDIDAYLDTIPEYKVPAESRAAMRSTRMGAVVGATVAKRNGWRVGDRITLHSTTWVTKDGSNDWPLEIVGLVNAGPDDDRMFANDLMVNYDYLDARRAIGEGTVHQFVVAVDAGADPSAVAKQIDELFANSSDETTTVNEQQWIASVAAEVGDLQRFVDWIIGAVLFTLLLLAGSVMSQSVRHRSTEFGVLKALGFRDDAVWALVVAEAAIISVVAAAIGLAIAAAVFPAVFHSIASVPMSLSLHVYVAGFAIASTLAFVSASLPALRARRLSVVSALSGR